jgi:DNA-binding transcriptional MerR regulator
MADADDQAIYSIGAVSRMLEIAPATLRTWEDRYGVVVARRSSGGQRRYSREQVASLRFISDQIQAGMSPGDAHRILTDRQATGAPELAPAGSVPASVLILVADRDPYAAKVAEYFLRTEGFRVEVTRTAAEAEERLGEIAPELVILDLTLSGGFGRPLLERVQETDAKLVVVSSLAAGEIAAELGADAFLQKPIDPIALVSVVRDLLRTSALTSFATTVPRT